MGDIVPPALRANGVAITLQNGLGNEEALAEIVGPERVMGGLCFLCSNKAGPGHIRHLDYGQITLGEYAPGSNGRGITPRLRDIGDDLQRAGIPVELTGDLRLARWQKLLWNVPFNGLSVVLDATTDQLMADPATRRLAEALMREIRGGAQACGVEIQEKTIQEMLRRTEKMTPYRTSMKIDFDERRPMEIEAIFGAPLRAAREAGFDAPRLDALCAMLRFLDARNRSVNG
ncbi:MAG: 2-dehydropantoate 2-reductase [candidate division BRC1 bacterium ADurb.BinA364]|nr:MAG: 2-dehydropantoate 2-reductase [candidate division BRC1 bacterium ADurb.BinA364]